MKRPQLRDVKSPETKNRINPAYAPFQKYPFPKANELFSILNDIKTQNEKVLIFANRKKIFEWLRDSLWDTFEVNAQVICGDVTDSVERMRIIEDFSNQPGFNALILSPRAAGVGLNITAANHVIHYTREWNPAIEKQATDRAYRLGQKKPVQVYTITSTSPNGKTVEEHIDDLLSEKRALMNQFVVPLGGYALEKSEIGKILG